MLHRISSFDDFAGHANLITYFKNHLDAGTLPQFLIFDGEEGLGKSSFAKLLAMGVCCTGADKPCGECPSCKAIKEHVIEHNESTENVLLYNMSIEGGKDAAKSVVSNLTKGFRQEQNKVIILDEAHGMSDAAQDAFLVDTEYLPKGVYMFLATTNTGNLSKTLKSRAITIPLHKLSSREMVSLLRDAAEERNLIVQSPEKTFDLIAAWADGKPRVALNLLDGFSKGSTISTAFIRELTRTVAVEDTVALVEMLATSMVHGVMYIQEAHFDESMFGTLTEIIRVKKGMPSYKLSMDENVLVQRAVLHVPEENLMKFVYEVASLDKVTTRALTGAFIRAHVNFAALEKKDDGILREELSQKADIEVQDTFKSKQKVVTLEELLKGGTLVE